MWEWHKRSLRVNTRLQRESAINTIYFRCAANLIYSREQQDRRSQAESGGFTNTNISTLCITIMSSIPCSRSVVISVPLSRQRHHLERIQCVYGSICRWRSASEVWTGLNTVVGRRQFDNSLECIAKKRQWRRHVNENTLEQNASIDHIISCIFVKYRYMYSTTISLTIVRQWAVDLRCDSVGLDRCDHPWEELIN